MTISREGREIYFECDAAKGRCAEVCETGTSDFSEALDTAKQEGWKVKKVGDQWEHYCPIHAKDARA